MDWSTLFSSQRTGFTKKTRSVTEGRSEFQIDFDRIIFSPAFRRLQSKTQVVPLPENDFVHTRLTHSLEASCVGRSLGKIAGDRIIATDPALFKDIGVTASDFEAVVAAACLAHDIGNPPFGHSGEDAISEYFKGEQAQPFLQGLSEKQIADLQMFEGNAAGFRILTHTSPSQSELNRGLGLTYATLGTFAKYPKESLPNLKSSSNASEKKYGFFQSEKEIFTNVAETLRLIPKNHADGLLWHRHPLAFLVEAADDICYSVVDLEDGYKMGRVPFSETEELLIGLLDFDFSKMESTYRKILDKRGKIEFLRALAINSLVTQTIEVFSENLPQIMSGKFDTHLTDLVDVHKTLQEISDISVKKIYRAREVLEIEIAGFEVLAGLLDSFLKSIYVPNSKLANMIRQLIPNRYFDKERKPFSGRYQSILNITEFISGMTDTFAISTYRKIKGLSLGN